jgi:hypothetical protein
MNLIRHERAKGWKPGMGKMQSVWDQAQTKTPADELLYGPNYGPLDPKKAVHYFRQTLAALRSTTNNMK